MLVTRGNKLFRHGNMVNELISDGFWFQQRLPIPTTLHHSMMVYRLPRPRLQAGPAESES